MGRARSRSCPRQADMLCRRHFGEAPTARSRISAGDRLRLASKRSDKSPGCSRDRPIGCRVPSKPRTCSPGRSRSAGPILQQIAWSQAPVLLSVCHSNATRPKEVPGSNIRKTLSTWSPLTESNRRPSPYHGDALPTELRGRVFSCLTCDFPPPGGRLRSCTAVIQPQNEPHGRSHVTRSGRCRAYRTAAVVASTPKASSPVPSDAL